jgi:hypothetical protein
MLLVGLVFESSAMDSAPPNRRLAATRVIDADQDFRYQGEYLGQVTAVDGRPVVFGLQVVALGDGQFSAMGYQDGLPGNGWDGETTIAWQGVRQDGLLVFDGPRGRIVIQGGAGLVIDSSGTAVGQVQRIRRVSATLGSPPPPGALVLFDGSSTDAFQNAKLTSEGWLDVGALTRTAVEDFRLHLEFRLPYMPYARSQGRANSGVYIQRRYEVQILDSFGLEPVFNGCAALYRQQIPDLNMSFPPLAWQTYDIFFTAARWDEEGDKLANARITVYHNGVAVHTDREVPTKTGAGKAESPEPGPILLQDHGNPVRFRNVWLSVVSANSPATQQQQVNRVGAADAATHLASEQMMIPDSHGDCDHSWSVDLPTCSTGSGVCVTPNCPGYGGWVLWRGDWPN